MSDGLWIIEMSFISTFVVVGFIELLRALRRPILHSVLHEPSSEVAEIVGPVVDSLK